ncbi:MAG: Sarcosine oxidase, delta subunit [Pseudomonadota bacterium]|jgi:sarcosine oxidase subunit delta
MLLIACPHCGPRAQAEFVFERPVETIFGVDTPTAALVEKLYTRTNPRGVSIELWRHARGCRAWLQIDRNTVTHVISAVCLWQPAP